MLLLASMMVPIRGQAAPIRQYNAMVPMSDGVKISATLYMPPEGTPLSTPQGFPLIVRQHGGGASKDSEYDVKYGLKAVETGRFALLMYSQRGHGDSEGFFDFFGERTTQDFSELLDWVDAKFDEPAIEGSYGNVGTWGYSQGGGESLLPAMADHRVKAVAVGNTFDDLNHALNPNDCFKFSFATGIFALAYKTAAAKTDDATALRWGAQWNTDTEDVPLPLVGSTTDEAYARSPAAHVVAKPGTTYDAGLNVPVFWSNSWEDALFPADHGIALLDDLRRRGIPTHLWFASGGHEAGANDPADEAGKEEAMLEWFEEFLLGEDRGYASGARPRVDYAQRVPDGGWSHHTASDWPVPGAGSHALTLPFDAAPITNTAASANIATEPIISNRSGGAFASVPDSQNPLDTIESSRFSLQSKALVGAPRASIRYSTTAKRVVQFNVKLWETAPDGSRRLITRGCFSDETPADGLAEFDLWPNAHAVRSSRSIWYSISSVDVPTFKADTEPHVTVIKAGTTVTLPALF